MDINREFGKKVYKLRIANNLTQVELAEETGLSRKYIQILESKKPKSPTLVTIKKLSGAFKLQPWQMLLP